MKEIGSEFWKINDIVERKNDSIFLDEIGKDIKYLMSGRTAIDYILNNINDIKKIVYMPEYCCGSMVQPFIDNGYRIDYYKVDLIHNIYYINELQECSIFFGMSYFGYNDSNMDKYIEKFKEKNVIVIEDITHRLLSKKNHSEKSDFLIASLRKWFPIYTGAIAVNKNCNFKINVDNYTINEELVKYKKQAMQLKREYIHDTNVDSKDNFLDLFNKSNKLIVDYKNKKMDEESIQMLKNIDVEYIIEKRISNTKIIEENFINNDNVKLLYNYKNGDCPLFVPIILKNRDNIRKKLIKNNIFCPVHWPKFNNSNNELYANELSLICDQRYTKEDMQREVKILFENI